MAFRGTFVWNKPDGSSTTISPGDWVQITTPHGGKRSGRVVFAYDTHVTINAGGKHGTPAVGNNTNIIQVRRRRV